MHKGRQVIKTPLEQLRVSWPGPGADLGTDLLLRASPGFQLPFQEGLASEGWECQPQAWPANLGGSWGSMSLLGSLVGRPRQASIPALPWRFQLTVMLSCPCRGLFWLWPCPQWGWRMQKAGFSAIW